MRKYRSSVLIKERESEPRWMLFRDDSDQPEFFETAMAALESVKANDNTLVEIRLADIALTIIEWQPRTRVGKAVVAAIVNG